MISQKMDGVGFQFFSHLALKRLLAGLVVNNDNHVIQCNLQNCTTQYRFLQTYVQLEFKMKHFIFA